MLRKCLVLEGNPLIVPESLHTTILWDVENQLEVSTTQAANALKHLLFS